MFGASWIFGYDFFISFTLGPAPRGTQSFASDLARRLRELDFAVFFSEDEAAPGTELDATLRRALKKSRVLVVVANEAALFESRWVREEVTEFRRCHPARPVVPISVDALLHERGAEADAWLHSDRNIWLTEPAAAVAAGIATDGTVKRLAITPRSMKSNTRLRLTVATVVAVLAGLTVAAWILAREAEAQRDIAISRQLAAQSVSTAGGRWARSILLSLAAVSVRATVEARSALFATVSGLPDRLHFLWGHSGAVRSVAFSPDGSLLASGGEDNTVVLWDTARHVRAGPPLKGHRGIVRGVAFSPDGKLVASCAEDGTVMLWRVAERVPAGPPLAHAGVSLVSGIAFNADGTLLAAGGNDGSVVLWNVATLEAVGEPMNAGIGPVRAVAFSPDGVSLASAGGDDGRIVLWDVAARRPRFAPLAGHQLEVLALAFSADGRWLASGSADETVTLWDAATGLSAGAAMAGHQGAVMGVAFSPDGHWLASSSYNDRLILWDTARREIDRELLDRHDRDGISSVAFSRDGRQLASGNGDGTIIVTDPSVTTPTNATLVGFGDGASNMVYLLDLRTRRARGQPLAGHDALVLAVAFQPTGGLLASGDERGRIRLWQTETGQPVGEPLWSHADAVGALAFSPDGRFLASASSDGDVIVWDVAAAAPVGPPLSARAGSALAVAYSPNGGTIATGHGDGKVWIWDASTRQAIGPPLGEGSAVHQVAFTPDGTVLAAASGDRSVARWHMPDRAPLPRLTLGRAAVFVLAFSPDGHMMAMGSAQLNRTADNKLTLIDTASGESLGERALPWPVFGIVFSPDRKALLYADGSGLGSIDVDLAVWKAKACGAVNRDLSPAEWRAMVGTGLTYRRVCPELPQGAETP